MLNPGQTNALVDKIKENVALVIDIREIELNF